MPRDPLKPKRRYNRPLTPKQRRYVNEFVRSRNGTEAAIKAGYAKASADSTTAKLQDKASIRDAIREQTRSVSESTAITIERVLREVSVMAFSSLEDFFDFDTDDLPTPRTSKDVPKESIRALKSIKITKKTTRGKGEDAEEETTETIEYTLWDKTAAIEKLAKHFGLFLEAEEVRQMHAELSELLARTKAGLQQAKEAAPVDPGSNGKVPHG